MLGPGELHPGCVPRTKLATRDTGYQSRCFSQIVKDVFFGEKSKVTGSRLTGHCSRKDLCFGSTAPSSPLLHKRSQGHYVLQGEREGVLGGRKDEEVGLWTQTLLARDGLDGWPGLRPYVDDVLAGSVAPAAQPAEGTPLRAIPNEVEFPTFSSRCRSRRLDAGTNISWAARKHL